MKFQIGKKYTLNKSKPWTCIGFKRDGFPVVESEHGDKVDWVSRPDLWKEYIEPQSGCGYINVNRGSDGSTFMGQSHKTRDAADKISNVLSGIERLACVRVEWKEGQFDD